MRRFLPVILLAALFMLPMGAYGQVAVNEEAGPLTTDEQVLLERLSDHGIPVPDSISIVDDTTGHLFGYVDRIRAPRTVHLTPTRMKHPNDVEMGSGFPYLFGVENVSTDGPSPQTHVLAHETAHILSVHLNPEMGRPALGFHTHSGETQADILGLVLGQMAFGWSPDDLGFPEVVKYPLVKNKPVSLLARQYCQMVKRTWSVEEIQCGFNGVLTSED